MIARQFTSYLRFAFLLLALRPASCWADQDDLAAMCTLSGRNYDGVRLLQEQELAYNWTSGAEWMSRYILINCKSGVAESVLSLPHEDEIFNNTLTFPNSDLELRLVRRNVYAGKKHVAHFLPGSLVGALWRNTGVQGSENIADWSPSLPLVSDEGSNTRLFSHLRDVATVSFVRSIMKTPDVLDELYPRNNAWMDYANFYEQPGKNDEIAWA